MKILSSQKVRESYLFINYNDKKKTNSRDPFVWRFFNKYTGIYTFNRLKKKDIES